MRALVVLGGGFVLLVLGAGVAGAAQTPNAAVDHVPTPPIGVSLPVPAAPHLPLGPIAIRVPGIAVDVGATGTAVRVDPSPITAIPVDVAPPVPALPDLPRSPVGPRPAAVPAGVVPTPSTAPAPPTVTKRHPSAAVLPAVLAPAVDAPKPSPGPGPAPVPAAPLLDLAALALGIQLSPRRSNADEYATAPTGRAVRALLGSGAATSARILSPRPGFGLLLTRPG